MIKYRASKVFVPGGMPEHTYVDRTQRVIRTQLESAKDNLCKLVTLTGQTKSGKTVLTQKIFSDLEPENVWIDGGSISNENDLWEQIVDHIGAWSTEEISDETSSSQNLGGEVAGGGNALFVKVEGKVSTGLEKKAGKSSTRSRVVSSKTAALKALRDSATNLIIDDFHYLDRELQGDFVRAIKPLVFRGKPVIVIAIPHRRYDAVKVEKEITGRVEDIPIPYWDDDELVQIPVSGFPLLNVRMDEGVVYTLANEALGSPHLMQEFCRSICRKHGIIETTSIEVIINEVDVNIFTEVAEGTGKIIFDKLATGPRQRSDRMLRQLKNGEEVDIYKVVLYALAKLKPSMQTVTYEELRAAIRDIIVPNSLPQAHEVSRVLDKMSEIAASDESSTPVLDWEKEDQRLHITDPFFAFYLKWGAPQL